MPNTGSATRMALNYTERRREPKARRDVYGQRFRRGFVDTKGDRPAARPPPVPLHPRAGKRSSSRYHHECERSEGARERNPEKLGDDVSNAEERLRINYDAMQDDIAAVLRALGISDHARPMSPHQVMVDVIIPAIERLRASAQVGETEPIGWEQWQRFAGNEEAAAPGTKWSMQSYGRNRVEGRAVWPEFDTHGNVAQVGYARWHKSQRPVFSAPVPEATDDLEALREAWESGAVTRILDHGGMFFGWTEDGDVGVFTMAGAMAGRSPSIAKGDTAWDAIVALRAALALSTPTDSESGESDV